jgi:DNA-binding transcriptional ArsR family regulator
MEMKTAIDALAALAQETRLQIFRRLVWAGECGIPAGMLGRMLNVPAPTLSFHLNLLCNAGLVERQRKGRSIIYAVKFAGIRELLEFLMEDCCQGDPALCGTATPAQSEKGCKSCES